MNDSDDPEGVGDVLARRIAELRKGRDWSAREAARYAGIGQKTWLRLERGQEAKISTLLRVQRVFELSTIEALLGELPSQRVDPGG